MKRPSDLWILSIIIVGFSSIIVFFNFIIWLDPSVNTDLNFQGQSQTSVFNGDLILNSIQSQNSLYIFGLNFAASFQLRISNLNEINSGREIPSAEITLTDKSIPQMVTPETPRVVNLSINNSKWGYGEYQGALFIIDGANHGSIPVTYDVKPVWTKPMILVVDGIAISIAAWKIIQYLNSTNTDGITPKPKFKRSGAVSYAVRPSVFGKNIILDVGTIVFGITLGLIGLPTSDAILTVHAIDPPQIATLIGIGLGIGSLKEFITRKV